MKAKNEIITLQVMTGEKNKNGFISPSVASEDDVYAEISSVKRTEFNQAQREGVLLSITATIGYEDWVQSFFSVGGKVKKPTKVIYEDTPHKIYRTYKTNDSEIELILEEIE